MFGAGATAETALHRGKRKDANSSSQPSGQAPDPRVVSLMTRSKLGIAWVEY
jgi:hypothetical protein